MLNFSSCVLSAYFVFLCVSVAHGQDTRVIVVPLLGGGNEIDQCKVTTACTAGQATVTCPNGDIKIPCSLPKRVFLTSSTFSADFGGLAGADAICQQLADDVNLTGTFKAWLSDGSESPSSRFTRSNGPYIGIDDEPIASSYQDLTDGSLLNPICVDEMGADRCNDISLAWTGTTITGEGSMRFGNCENWTTTDTGGFGDAGGPRNIGEGWTSRFAGDCSDPNALYCMEQ